MARSVLLVVVGALLGGVGTYLIGSPAPAPNESMSTESVARTTEDGTETVLPPAPNQVRPALPDSGIAVRRLGTYERAMQATGALELEAMLGSAGAAPRSRSRDVEISVLLARLAELDPRRAVEYAQTAFLDAEFLVQAHVALARADAELALSDLRFITPPAKQRRVAVALLDVLGNDELGVARIAQALPASQRVRFDVDALLVRAEADPTSVLASALEYDRVTLQTYLLPRLAETAAQRDPLGALAFSESITDPSSRSTFQSALLNAWADVEPASLFEWLEAADRSIVGVSSVLSNAFPALANADPERLLAMVDHLPASVRRSAQRAVMATYAERDPVTAIAMLESMTVGRDRESLLQTIAQNYGEQNPDLALDWARSLTPPSPAVVHSVLRSIATVDADRAIDAFIAELDRPGAGASAAPRTGALTLSFVSTIAALSSSGTDVGRLTNSLLESSDRDTRSLLSTALSSWASRDVNAALDWTLANVDALDASVLRTVAPQLGVRDFDLAVSTMDRLPPAQREGWFQGLVSQMAMTDVEAALDFVNAYRGQPGFDAALGDVIHGIARSDPVRAARVLTESGASEETMRRSAVVAREWAARDPAAAARWALEDITNAEAQTGALRLIAGTWAQRDTPEAERWLFSLESGPNRDAAADGLMSASAEAGRFELRILDAYSSESSRQWAAGRAIVTIARTDPIRARELMDAHLTDPAVRTQAEANIARMSSLPLGR